MGSRPGSLRGEPAVAGEAPGAVHEDADADALRLPVGDGLDLAVFRGDMLDAPRHPACVGVCSAGAERNLDRLSAQLSQGPT